MSNELEKDLDDEVYEDSYYDDDEEELEDEDEKDLDDEESSGEVTVSMSFVCEDCDYRWDDYITKDSDEAEDDDSIDVVCPMCGSVNVSQI